MARTALFIGHDTTQQQHLEALLQQHSIPLIALLRLDQLETVSKEEVYWIFIEQKLAFSAADNLKQAQKCAPKAPCIVLATSEEIDIAAALEQDLSYYWSIPCDAARLQALLEKSHNPSIQLYQHYNIRTLDEAKLMAKHISAISHTPGSVEVGLSEILFNSIEHGNLEISFEVKTRLKEENTWLEEIAHRQKLPEYQKKFIDIQITLSADALEIYIKDQGKGFNWQKFLELDPIQLRTQHGRGIFMASQLSFKKMSYLGCGNEVLCTIAMDKPP